MSVIKEYINYQLLWTTNMIGVGGRIWQVRRSIETEMQRCRVRNYIVGQLQLLLQPHVRLGWDETILDFLGGRRYVLRGSFWLANLVFTFLHIFPVIRRG